MFCAGLFSMSRSPLPFIFLLDGETETTGKTAAKPKFGGAAPTVKVCYQDTGLRSIYATVRPITRAPLLCCSFGQFFWREARAPHIHYDGKISLIPFFVCARFHDGAECGRRLPAAAADPLPGVQPHHPCESSPSPFGPASPSRSADR